MKITAAFLFAACLQVHAAGYGQTVTLSVSNAPVPAVFKEIIRQTGVSFIYNEELFKNSAPVTIHVKSAPIASVLDQCLKDKPYVYSIENGAIIVKPVLSGTPALSPPPPPPQPPKVVEGVVLDSAGNPLSGVSVTIRGTSYGTTTDRAGHFSLTLPAGTNKATLVFSYVGMAVQEQNWTEGTAALRIMLRPALQDMNEVVVQTGYVTERKKDLTGAVSIVNVADMTTQPNSQVANIMQGQAAGVTVIQDAQPGGNPTIRIRGINTFGNNVPLFVIDGVPTQNIADLNAYDIASMQVLKDAGSASIYGSRASNGVVIITTRRGNGKVSVHYDAYFGEQVPPGGNVWHELNPQGQADLEWEAYKNAGVAPSDPEYGSGPTPVLPDYIYPVGAPAGSPQVNPSLYYVNPNYTALADYNSFYRIVPANKSGTDWFHAIFKTRPMTSHNISVDGGSDRGSYLFSLSYFDQDGSMIDTYNQRYTLRSNATYNVSKNIRVGENLATSITHNPQISDLTTNDPILFTMLVDPIVPIYDIKGNYAGVYGTPYNGGNAVAIQQRSATDRATANRLFGNIFADVDFLKQFTFHTSFGGENLSGTGQYFNYPTYENQENNTISSYMESSSSGYDWTWTNTLAFHQRIGHDHDIRVLLGTEAYKAYSEALSGTTEDYYSFSPNYTTLSSGTGQQTNASSRSGETLSSQFGRLDYSYKDKYLLSGTLRRDGSSVFIDQQYGWFPAVSGGWRLSQESFMEGISWIRDLKVRSSWGIMGNQLNVTPNNGFSTYYSSSISGSSDYDIDNTNNSTVAGFQVAQIGNPAAKWEKDINSNIGVDATLLGGKIDLSVDYYTKAIKDLLYNPPVPGTEGGGTAPSVNVAAMRNRGVDLYMALHQAAGKNWKLDESVTFTSYHNVIEKVDNSTTYFDVADERGFNGDFIRNEVGHSLGQFFGYKVAGFWNSAQQIADSDAVAQKFTGTTTAVYQQDEGVGRWRYAETAHDRQISTDDRTFIGNPNPKFNYGVNLKATFRSLDVSVFVYGVYGNQDWNVMSEYEDFFGGINSSKSIRAMNDSWTPTHTDAKLPIQLPLAYQSEQSSPNSYFTQNASYLRLKNMQLGYTLPAAVDNKLSIQRLRLYVQAANLFTVTRYRGLDPEVSGNSVTEFGVDEGIYPNVRTFLVGINLIF